MGDMTYIKVQHDDELAIVSIDRQEKLNALNGEVVQELGEVFTRLGDDDTCLLYTSPSPRDRQKSRMPSSA